MAIERDNPGDLARRAAERRGRRSNHRPDTDQWRRESYCLPRLLARAKARELFEREYLDAQIMRFGGNISRTASFIGMERSALHRKLKSLGVAPARSHEDEEEDA